MQLTLYFDYTCEDSFQVHQWLESIQASEPSLSTYWATFSLKELNRQPGALPAFDDPDQARELSLFALALAQAARFGDFSQYHQRAFELFHGRQTPNEEALLHIARGAGVNVEAFREDYPRWLEEAAREHRNGAAKWKIRGTPTLVFDNRSAVMLRLAEARLSEDHAWQIWRHVSSLAMDDPELLTFRRAG